ncbi:MAG TPA: hypothetical protein VFZ49_09870, partial [Pyrinomonadaceae bacterium]
FVFVSSALAQVPAPKEKKPDDGELRKEAVAFLRETMADVASMRTLENRISFSAELAGLMWFHEENEAKQMFNTAISGFRELISRLDAQMSAMPAEDSEGVPGMGLLGDGTERGKLMMKYRVAMAVRQQIATSIAEHDADVALSFFYDTTSAYATEQFGGRDTYFEFSLLQQISERNPSKAAQYGIKTLEKGLQSQHVTLLQKICEKDAEVAKEFGAALLKTAKATKFELYELYSLSSLMEFGEANLEASLKPGGKKAVYSHSDMRDLADIMATQILKSDDQGFGMGFVSYVEKWAPGRAAQLRAKFKTAAPNANTNASYRYAANSVSNAANTMANANYSVAVSPEVEARQATEEKLMADVQKMGNGELPKEERDKVVSEARRILMRSTGKDKQIMGLSMLAAQVAKAGDKELAAQIMRDAESLVNPYPKNYQDFLHTWMLVSGYAEADPEKAFPILEAAIGRANDLISAFVRVGEFIDVTEEMISDGEVQVGAFGGGMIRGLSKELGIAESTLGTLVHADFAKTKALTNRFDRPEARVLAKMLVLRSVLGKNAPPPTAEEQVKKVMGQN